MFNSSLSFGASAPKSPGKYGSQDPADAVVAFPPRLVRLDEEATHQTPHADQSARHSGPAVSITPHRMVTSSRTTWRGIGIELVKAAAQGRTDYAFHSSSHLLVAYQQGIRRDGESHIDGLPRSTLRDLGKKLTIVPAGHRYHEWQDSRVPTCVTYFYFDPARIDFSQRLSGKRLLPRLLFEDATIWNTVEKLRQAIESVDNVDGLYVEALGTVLLHEISRLNRGSSRTDVIVKGGLAAWQQRVVTAYIEEHLSEQVSLATLANLVRLSTFHFCRAFKQSFGVPPHRYHTSRRIECAKTMLAERKHSVTEIGLAIGFSETSSFTAAFRKITGQSPSRYHRALG
jgi:AraC family transcriptional regulator